MDHRSLFSHASSIAALAAAGSILAGCTTIKSEKRVQPAFEQESAAGLTYFLPQKFVTIDIKPKMIDPGNIKKELKKAQDALGKALEEKASADKEATRLEALVTGLASESAAKDKLQQEWSIAKVRVTISEKEAKRLDQIVKELEAEIEMARSGSEACKFEVSATLSASYPDPTNRMLARPVHQALRDDTAKIAVSPGGLLSSANAVAVDQSGQILAEIAGAVSAMGSRNAFEAKIGPPSTATRKCADLIPIKYTFNPLEEDHLTELSGYLGSYGLRIKFDKLGSSFLETNSAISGQSGLDDPLKQVTALDPVNNAIVDGLFYRSSAPVLMLVEQKSTDSTWLPADASILMLPQAGPVSYIPFRSSAFVKTVDDVEFVNGEIKSWSTDRPSEVLEVVRLPVKILKSIVSIPAEILSIKVDYSSDANQLAQNQALFLQQEKINSAYLNCLNDSAGDLESVNQCTEIIN